MLIGTSFRVADTDYPKAIYADGGTELLWGEPIKTRIVLNAEEEGEALSNGWRLHPFKASGDTEPKRRGRPPMKREAE